MLIFRNLYRLYKKSTRIICEAIDRLRTLIRFKAYCNKFGRFTTYGVPYIYVSRQKSGNINIGDNFVMNNGLSNNVIGFGKTPCVLSVFGGNITIRDNVGISQSSLIAINADIVIGNNVKLGSGTKIYTCDFHPIEHLYRRDDYLNQIYMKSSAVTIEDDCFIGAGTIILKGVTIGARTVVGAGSVVTKSLPADCIAAGNPCRFIRVINNQEILK